MATYCNDNSDKHIATNMKREQEINPTFNSKHKAFFVVVFLWSLQKFGNQD
jgi:hypothetical protein